MGNRFFEQALRRFTEEAAGGGAVRHLADLGYTVDRIAREIDFPLPKDRVAQIVWQHYIDRGIILLEEPGRAAAPQEVTYVKETGRYGTVSLRRVVRPSGPPGDRYLPCDFGKERYRNEEGFLRRLQLLDEDDRAYILGLPWPLQRVYHLADERMGRIQSVISNRTGGPQSSGLA